MLSVLPILFYVFFLNFIELQDNLNKFIALSIWFITLHILFWATIEEILKYLVVKINLKNSELDEPIDIMLYMIIAGLGFAAFENILILIGAHPLFTLPDIFILTFFRFITATFLHALCSGVIGYFWALSFYQTKQKKKLFFTGLILASLLHGFYNFAIIVIGGIEGILIIITILIGLFIFTLLAFPKLKKIKSICIIK